MTNKKEFSDKITKINNLKDSLKINNDNIKNKQNESININNNMFSFNDKT